MAKNVENNWHKGNIRLTKTVKHYLLVLGIMLIAVVLIITLSLASSTSAVQTVNTAEPQSQFRFNIDYAYVGHGPLNNSYSEPNGAIMSIVSQYPSAIELNITRLPGTQIVSCDAALEVYKIQIITNTGLMETDPYFIGTNFNPTFSHAEISTLFAHASDLIASQNFSTPLRGNFEFNWTANTSILSTPIGSVGVYSTGSSGRGLWSAGNPNAISVTIQRIGYVTISNGSISLYKDASNTAAAAMAQLNNYGNGFLHNNIVPAAKLPQTDLFHPIA